MAVTIQTRRDDSADWTTANPVLALGEIGIETDTDKAKYGDGFTTWNDLDYWDLGADGGQLPAGTNGQVLRYGASWEATSDLVINDSGSVGIGTAASDNRLTIEGDGVVAPLKVDALTNTRPIVLNSDGAFSELKFGGATIADVRVQAHADALAFNVNGIEGMRIDSLGNVGIGTDSPESYVNFGNPNLALVHSGGGGAELNIINLGGTGECSLTFGDGAGAAAFTGMIRYANAVDAMTFFAAGLERARITSDGNVGIGLPNPASRLHINGETFDPLVVETVQGVCNIQLVNSIQTIKGNLWFGSNFTSATIGTGGAERMRIDASGSLLVGLTTGGQGAGTINVSGGYFVNGTPVVLASELATEQARVTALETQLAALVAVAQTNGWSI